MAMNEQYNTPKFRRNDTLLTVGERSVTYGEKNPPQPSPKGREKSGWSDTYSKQSRNKVSSLQDFAMSLAICFRRLKPTVNKVSFLRNFKSDEQLIMNNK
jgi:hypothetical protein